jgi:hypothetical protein
MRLAVLLRDGTCHALLVHNGAEFVTPDDLPARVTDFLGSPACLAHDRDGGLCPP